MKTERPLLAFAAVAVVCIVWGTTYVALRFGVAQFPAFLFSAIRLLVAGGLLVGFLLTFGKLKFPDWSVIRVQALAGFFMFAMGNGLVGWAEINVSSGLAAIISSMIPIWVILLNMRFNEEERPNFPIVVGLIIGMSGIVMIFGQHVQEFSNPAYQFGIIAMFVANLSWAAGSVWIKKKNQHTNLFLNAGIQMLFGGLFLVPTSLLFDDFSNLTFSAPIAYTLLYLIFIGSIFTYICFSYALKKLPVTIVSLYAYINPLVAVFLGWLLLDEKFSVRILIAMLITVAGVYLVNRGYQVSKEWRAQLAEKE